MKTCVLLTLFCLSSIVARSQVVAIQNNYGRKLILCLDNPLTIAVEGLLSKDISVSTNNGTIRENKAYGEGHYLLHPNSYGPATIYVKRKNANNSSSIIDSVCYFVQRLPATPRFANRTSGELSHPQIVVQIGITANVENFDINARFPIQSYSVLVYRNNIEIFRRNITGATFDESTSNFFYTLRNDDRLKFIDIKFKDCDGEMRSADSINIAVKDAVHYQKIKQVDTMVIEDPITGNMVIKKSDSVWVRNSK